MRLVSILLLVFALIKPSLAAFPGFYIGAQVGQSTSDYSRTKAGLASLNTLDDSGLSGRFHFGYQFDQYWTSEFAYARYATVKFDDINGTSNKGLLKQHSLEILGKGILPLSEGLGMFSKLGAAILYTDPNTELKNASSIIQDATDRTHLVVGLGASYDIDANTEIGCSWSRILKRGHVQHIDFVSIDLTYHFG